MARPINKHKSDKAIQRKPADYNRVLAGVVELLEAARSASARVVNSLMTATYWEIGRRIVEHEQAGKERAAYGAELLILLWDDLTKRFGRGFSVDNLERARKFYLTFVSVRKSATVLRISTSTALAPISATPLRKSPGDEVAGRLRGIAAQFPLPWSHYTHPEESLALTTVRAVPRSPAPPSSPFPREARAGRGASLCSASCGALSNVSIAKQSGIFTNARCLPYLDSQITQDIAWNQFNAHLYLIIRASVRHPVRHRAFGDGGSFYA